MRGVTKRRASPNGLNAAILENHGEVCETYATAKEYQAKLKHFNEDDEDETSVEYDALQETKDEFLQALLEDYRMLLQKEYEYQTSEEAIIDTIKANEYEFTEDGKHF